MLTRDYSDLRNVKDLHQEEKVQNAVSLLVLDDEEEA